MAQAKFDPIAGEIVPSWSVDLRRTFKLFLPIFLGSIATTAMSVVDTVMAGMAGTIQLSGVAIGASLYTPCALFVMGMTLAIQPTVAQLRGAGRTNEIAPRMHLISVVTLITSVLVGLLMCALPLCYKLMGDIDQEMVRVAELYLYSVATAMPAIALFNILRGYWEGLGNTVPTSIFGFLALFLNIPLNWIFIFGHFGMPALGGVGCGVATSITMYICAIFMLIYVLKSKTYAQYRIFQHWFQMPWSEVKQFLHFSFPLALSTTIEVTCFSLVAMLLSPFGPVMVAAHSVAMNVSSIIFMIPLAIASAATIRVGEALGAGHWNRAYRSSLGVYAIAFFFYIFSVLTLVFFHQDIIELYSSDPEVISLASLLLMFCAVYQFPDGMQVVSIGILRGFKDSKTIFAVTVFSYWIVGMPIGYSLAYGLFTGEKMGAQGFWIGFICSLSCAFILYIMRIVYIYRRRKLPRTFHLTHSEEVPL